jgi:hypothetical protein
MMVWVTRPTDKLAITYRNCNPGDSCPPSRVALGPSLLVIVLVSTPSVKDGVQDWGSSPALKGHTHTNWVTFLTHY